MTSYAPIDSLISFRGGADSMLLAKVMKTAYTHLNTGDKPIGIAGMEAVRRAVALIEAVLTEQVRVQGDENT